MLSAKGGFEGGSVVFVGEAFWLHSVIGQLGKQVEQMTILFINVLQLFVVLSTHIIGASVAA